MADANVTPELPADFDSSRTYTGLLHLLINEITPLRGIGPRYDADLAALHAVKQHTENSMDTLPSFIQSLSNVLALAAISGELDMGDVASVAWLTKDLGNLLEACTTINANVDYAIRKRAAA
jgi:hypothetical protein